jgi:hypothetical protein
MQCNSFSGNICFEFSVLCFCVYTDNKGNKIFLINMKIHSGAVVKSYMTNGLLIQYMEKYLRISSYIRKPFLTCDFATAPL